MNATPAMIAAVRDAIDPTCSVADCDECAARVAEAVLALAGAHDGDCQAAQHTYVHQGEPGIHTHLFHRGRYHAADAIGSNGRRLLVRDDPDGICVGGAVFGREDATTLAGIIREFAERRPR